MKFFIDNNLSPHFAEGMKGFREDVTHLKECFPQDIADIDLLKKIGKNGWILITKDKRMKRVNAEKAAYKKYSVGGFVLVGQNLDRCSIYESLIKNWRDIKEKAKKTNRPFMYKIRARGKIVKEDLG